MINELVVVRSGGLRMRSAITATLTSTANTLAAPRSARRNSSNPEADTNADADVGELESSSLNPLVDLVDEEVVVGSIISFCKTSWSFTDDCSDGHSWPCSNSSHAPALFIRALIQMA